MYQEYVRDAMAALLKPVVVLVMVFVPLAGCKVSVISGPTKVEVGDTVTYVLGLSNRSFGSETGILTSLGNVGGGRTGVISPDGRHLYTSSGLYERDASTGLLTRTPVDDLADAQALAISPRGSYLIADDGVGLAVFALDPGTGFPVRVEDLLFGGLPVTCFDGIRYPTFSRDGRHLWVTSFEDDVLMTFETGILFSDGFESGDALSWTTTMP